MAYSVPDLPYDYDALEPHIDEATMRVHHDKHHQAYVDKANAALEGTEWADKDVEDVLKDLDSLPADKQGPVRNNAGGHANHTMFWEIMGPNTGGMPTGELAGAIQAAFGDFDQFKAKLKEAALGRFGSGRVLLKPAPAGKGVIAGGPVRAVIQAVGIPNVLTKSIGSHNPHNVVKATIDALEQLRDKQAVADLRGLDLEKVS